MKETETNILYGCDLCKKKVSEIQLDMDFDGLKTKYIYPLELQKTFFQGDDAAQSAGSHYINIRKNLSEAEFHLCGVCMMGLKNLKLEDRFEDN